MKEWFQSNFVLSLQGGWQCWAHAKPLLVRFCEQSIGGGGHGPTLLYADAACIAGSNRLVLVLCISCRRTEPLCLRPHGAESGHYPFMPGAYKAWGYDEIIIYRRPNKVFFLIQTLPKKKNLWGDMLIKIKKIIYTQDVGQEKMNVQIYWTTTGAQH